jgi:hypothetical protein
MPPSAFSACRAAQQTREGVTSSSWGSVTTEASIPEKRKERAMSRSCGRRLLLPMLAMAVGVGLPVAGQAACCYFSAKDKDILQPAQKVFITWDPVEKVESFTVQPKFEGNALDFGMVIPTPMKPKLDEMPRDFFKELAIYSILKKREQPQSKLLPQPPPGTVLFGGLGGNANGKGKDGVPHRD